ncbi:hypothetical protein KY343_03325 [Candidatus Woesearchaeota archaeon]|nr:hypothetical protein [Candidatus Woesearchaeota archaeon]
MVFVFGIDIPLVELIFVLTLVLIGLFALMIFIIIRQNRLNKRLESILSKENLELTSLKKITKEEETEANLLRAIRTELDRVVYGEAYGKKLQALLKKKGRKEETEKEKIKRMANSFWKEIVKISKKQRPHKHIIYGDTKTIKLKPKKKAVKKKR